MSQMPSQVPGALSDGDKLRRRRELPISKARKTKVDCPRRHCANRRVGVSHGGYFMRRYFYNIVAKDTAAKWRLQGERRQVQEPLHMPIFFGV